MGLRKLGDSAWIFTTGEADPLRRLDVILWIVRLLESNPLDAITDVVSSFDSVAVHFDPKDGNAVLRHLTRLDPKRGDSRLPLTGKTLTVPVAYGEGADLEALSQSMHISTEKIIRLHSSSEYTVAAIGFSPGFPYLLGLAPELQHPRLSTPRPVPAGAIAMAGSQAGIYPFASQGGWHVLGTTSLRLFDPSRKQPALLKPGDKVRFIPVTKLNDSETTPLEINSSVGMLEIIEPGALTSVQDLGRQGFQHIGVSPGGAIDPIAARVANRLVGNSDCAAVLECTMIGPLLKFHQDTRIAWIGWADTRSGKPHDVQAGNLIDLRSRMASLRGYIAIAGGIDVPEIMGSKATDVRARFGGFHGRRLVTGDHLPVIPRLDSQAVGDWRVGWPHPNRSIIELRFIKGVQSTWFSSKSLHSLTHATYQISSALDRTGIRLLGPPLELEADQEMISQPVVAGSIQVPPDGKPIILLAERQTIGGYPQIGHVISADLPMLARAWPGSSIRFREVTLDEARDAWVALQRELGIMGAGLKLIN